MDNTSKQSDLSKTIREYVKHWKLFLLSFFVCGVVAVAYLLIKNPEFEISANVLIKEDSKSGGMGGMASALMKNFAFSDVLGNVGGGVVDDELEIIVLISILIYCLDNLTFCNRFRTEYSLIVIGQTCKNLIRATIYQADESNPFFFIVLESYNVGLKFYRAFQYMLFLGHVTLLLFLFLS